MAFPLQFNSAIAGALLAFVLTAHASSEDTEHAAGEALYRQGRIPSGQLLQAQRVFGGPAEGTAAACVNCHRRSGLGSAEGKFLVPPITGNYLYRPRGRMPEDVDFRYGAASVPNFNAYNDLSLARAIRDGVARDGRTLNELMPRFQLDDDAMKSLVAYLKSLSPVSVPGVTEDTLHFATIVTPDADPAKRDAMLSVLTRFFDDKNEFLRGGTRPMRASKGVMYRVTRKWRLHVWELKGPENTWDVQLREKAQAEPVFAVISGIAGKSWAPVHRFCEREMIPCILPNVTLPVAKDGDFYSIYFSEEVLLEAKLIAYRLRQEEKSPALRHVTQIYREDDVGRAAAQSFSALMRPNGITVVDRVLRSGDAAQEIRRSLQDADKDGVVVLWLRPDDLRHLPTRAVGTTVYLSGLMGGLEHAPLPPAWKATARMTYPFDLPEARMVRMNFPLGWFKIRHIDVVDERVQTDTYLACRVLAESMGDMLESFIRDYLVEQIENMLSKRLVNGYYPRLSLASGQRFASKGGYVVRFKDATGEQIVLDGDWIVP